VIHRLIEYLVSDLVESTKERLEAAKISSVSQVLALSQRVVAPSAEIMVKKSELERFLFEHVYRHPNVLAERAVAEQAIRELFARFSAKPETLPQKYQSRLAADGVSRSVCDYLASMTDRFALGQQRGEML